MMVERMSDQRLAEVEDELYAGIVKGKLVSEMELVKALRADRKHIEELKEALRHISLASQNSMSSKEDCGRTARKALEKFNG